jgi:hypothetical protein
LKQAAEAQRQRRSLIAANSFAAIRFKSPAAAAQRQQSSPIPANSFAAFRFEAAVKQPNTSQFN